MFSFFQNHVADVIEGNEHAWVDNVIKCQVLPVPNVNDQKELENLGVVFKSNIPEPFKYETKRFVAVDLPSGWKYVPGLPDRRNIDLVNSQGQVIAKLFVKMGGYDNFASISILHEKH